MLASRRARSSLGARCGPSGVVVRSALGCRAPRASAAAAVPGRPARATQPSTLRWRPRATASAPGGTSSVMTEPAAGVGAVADRRPARRAWCREPIARRGRRPWCGAWRRRRSWRRSCRRRCWCPRRSRRRRRRTGAAPWRRRRSSAFLVSTKAPILPPRAEPGAGPQVGERADGGAGADHGAGRRGVRTTVAPVADLGVGQRACPGRRRRPRRDRGRAVQLGAGQERDVGRERRRRRRSRWSPGRRR